MCVCVCVCVCARVCENVEHSITIISPRYQRLFQWFVIWQLGRVIYFLFDDKPAKKNHKQTFQFCDTKLLSSTSRLKNSSLPLMLQDRSISEVIIGTQSFTVGKVEIGCMLKAGDCI